MTDQRVDTGARAPGELPARSTVDGHEAGAVTALEPNEPSRAARGRLRRAVAARAAIDHPNLIRVWPVGVGDGRLFIAFERCPHPRLADLVGAGPLEPAECARIVDGAAAGVEALSERALVARDLTPDRVFVDPKRGGMLMDLGIPPALLRPVPLEQDSDLAFRSPEERDRKPVDVRSSVYSLGAILFAALTGQAGDSRMTEARPRSSNRRARLSPEIDAVIARAMARDPAERYADPRALWRAAAAALGVDLAPTILRSDLKPDVRGQQRLLKRSPASPRRNGRPETTAPPMKHRPTPPQRQRHPRPAQAASPPPARGELQSASRPAQRAGAHLSAAVRRCLAIMAALLAVAGAAGRRGHARLRRFASVAAPVARSAASVAVGAARRGTKVVSGFCLRACRLRLAAARRGAVATGIRTAAQRCSPHRKVFLPAAGAIVASGLSGIALGRAVESEEAPSPIIGPGLTVQLPSGWKQADVDPGVPKLSSAISAVPSGEAGAGFVAGKVSSLAAAERVLERVRREGRGRTQVRLGRLHAWQYRGLRPRPGLVGTGYLVPTTGAPVLVICHASREEARARLAECKRAATTLVVRGERPRPLSSATWSNERAIQVIATFRSSRSRGRRRLHAAELARGQVRAATSLQLSHERAARSLDRIAALESGYSLGDLSAALRAAAAAYGRLAETAAASDPSAYRKARQAVLRQDEALRRELARTRAA